MRLQVLGKSPAWPEPGGASSGYLVTGAETRLLVDCGHGIAGKLREVCEPHDLAAVALTHLHMDHSADLTAIAYALKYMPHDRMGVRPLLLVGAGGREALRALGRLWDSELLFEDAFELVEFTSGEELEVGELRLRFSAVPHAVPTHAIDVRSDAARITFGADCGPNQALIDLARYTSLLVAEATLPEPDVHGIHLCAREAGEHAQAAGAKALMLTHFADAYDPRWVIEQASSVYDGPVSLAAGGLSVQVR